MDELTSGQSSVPQRVVCAKNVAGGGGYLSPFVPQIAIRSVWFTVWLAVLPFVFPRRRRFGA